MKARKDHIIFWPSRLLKMSPYAIYRQDGKGTLISLPGDPQHHLTSCL